MLTVLRTGTLLLAQFSHSWTNARGEEVTGVREAVLCPACDRGEPAADELLAFFAVDDQARAPTPSKCSAGLVAVWVRSVRHRTVDMDALNEEHEHWRRGEL